MKAPFFDNGQHFIARRIRDTVYCDGLATFAQDNGSIAGRGVESVPAGYRPDANAIILYSSNDPSVNGGILVYPSGAMKLYGKTSRSRYVLLHGSWHTTDPWPGE